MNNYVIYEEIGKGEFSVVHKGRKKRSIEFMTLKSFKKSRKDKVLNEVKILSLLSHPNIIQFQNWYETRNHFWTIYEYLAGSDLKKIVTQDDRLEELTVRLFSQMIIDALMYMHSKSIVFCELKPNNMVFDEYSNLKFVDFGKARLLKESEIELDEDCELEYIAPEIIKDNVFSPKADIWSLGILLYYLATGHPPFSIKNKKFSKA